MYGLNWRYFGMSFLWIRDLLRNKLATLHVSHRSLEECFGPAFPFSSPRKAFSWADLCFNDVFPPFSSMSLASKTNLFQKNPRGHSPIERKRQEDIHAKPGTNPLHLHLTSLKHFKQSEYRRQRAGRVRSEVSFAPSFRWHWSHPAADYNSEPAKKKKEEEKSV